MYHDCKQMFLKILYTTEHPICTAIFYIPATRIAQQTLYSAHHYIVWANICFTDVFCK